MLASFLTGIALGSAVASRIGGSRQRAMVAFPISQIGIGALSFAAFFGVDALPGVAVRLGAGSGAGALANAAVAALVLLPGAVFVGASFPLAVRILARGESDAGPASARVYAWNTAGAIIGSIGSGFVWIPLLHYHGALMAAVCVNLLVAVVAALLALPRRGTLAAVAAGLLVAAFAVRPGPPWKILTTSPLDVVAGVLPRIDPARVKFFAVGRSSTVMLRTGDDGSYDLLTNGLPEASVRPRGATLMDNTTTWLSGFPLLARPDARSLLAIGLGSGTVVERVPESVERIDVIELEAEVVEANRFAAPQRARDPLADPRTHVAVNDARGALQLTTRRWDVIASQPSHPWTAGASHLFTREFFELTRDHLNDDGILVQWLAPGFLDLSLLRSLIATMRTVFTHVELYWLPRDGAVFFLASDSPIDMRGGAAARLARSPHDFAHLGVHAPEDVLAYRLADDEGTRQLAAGAEVTTDTLNLLQFRAPRVLRDPLTNEELESAVAGFDPLIPVAAGIDAVRLGRRLAQSHQEDRARALADAAEGPGVSDAIRGILAERAGDQMAALRELRRAVAADPGLREAWVALTRKHPLGQPASYSLTARSVPAYPELSTVAEGWDRRRARDWEGLRSLDDALAVIPDADPVYPDALRLRAAWRVESGRAERGAEAVALLDDLLPLSHRVDDAIFRARALRVAGDPDAALVILGAILGSGDPARGGSGPVLDLVAAALEEHPPLGPHAERRRSVADALTKRRLGMPRP
jgi:hypothetical protein